jgi:hypothetical protein
MHAPVFKRTTSTQLIGLVLVIGLAASLALNVATLTRSEHNTAPAAAPRTDNLLLREQRRYYAAKEVRQASVEAAAGAQVAWTTALSASQERHADLKSDQMDGIATTRTTLRQRYVDLKSDQLNGTAPVH